MKIQRKFSSPTMFLVINFNHQNFPIPFGICFFISYGKIIRLEYVFSFQFAEDVNKANFCFYSNFLLSLGATWQQARGRREPASTVEFGPVIAPPLGASLDHWAKDPNNDNSYLFQGYP